MRWCVKLRVRVYDRNSVLPCTYSMAKDKQSLVIGLILEGILQGGI